MAYESLAFSYDRLTSDIPYEDILRFYREIMALYGCAPETVADLACGTGTMSLLLAKAGYRVLGTDMSEEMLTQAYAKAMESGLDNPPYFVRQKLQNLRLPFPVDCAVCCLDSLNYVTNPEDCRKAFDRIYNALNPGGLLIFDINSEAKLSSLDGRVFLDEDDDVYCVWRTEYNPETRLCFYGMDIFRREGEKWLRSAEEHVEYAYAEAELRGWLAEAGFSDIRTFGDRITAPPSASEQRIFFAAEKR